MRFHQGFIIVLALPAVSGLTADIQPGRRVRKDDDVVITCTANSRETTVFWERLVTGNSWVMFGTDGQLSPPFDQHRRYHMSTTGYGSQERTHVFRIKSSQYEDTSFYRCRARSTSAKKQVVLAVCDDPESSICRCVERKGMYDPSCFEGAEGVEEVHNRYRGTITGLIVCLVLAILIAIGFAAVLGFDCFKRMQAKRKRDAERQEHQVAAARSGRSPYDESEQLTLDPNETASQSGNTYNNEAFAPSYDDVMSKQNSRYSNGYGPKTPDRPTGPVTPRTPAGSQPRTPVGANSNTPVATVYNPNDALDPRNLDKFQFPPDGSSYPDSSAKVRDTRDYSRGDKSPGNFSVGSGDLDLLKTPYAASPSRATPRQPYNDVSSALPPLSSGARGTHYTEPKRLEFSNSQYPPYESSASPEYPVPRASTMI